MRIALLAAIKRDDEGGLRALLPLAGRSVLGWQCDFARRLGCERIMCLCEQETPDILAVQREMELSGVEFHLIRSNVQLVALLRSGDQIVVQLDGLIPEQELVETFDHEHERLKSLVLAIRSDAEVAKQFPEDFERIDAQRSWAGLTIVDASIAAKLADYPPDSEPISLLLRLALQAGVPCQVSQSADAATSPPLLATSHEALSLRQNELLVKYGELAQWSAPLVALSHWLAGRLILAEKRVPTWAILASGAVALLMSAILLWLEQAGAALMIAGLGAFAAQSAVSLQTLALRLRSSGPSNAWVRLVPAMIDIVAIAILIAALDPFSAAIERLILPVFAIGLARIAAQPQRSAFSMFWTDRVLHLLGFGAAAIAGLLVPMLTLFGIGALAHKLLQTQAK